MYISIYKSILAHMCLHVCRFQRLRLDIFLSNFKPYFFEPGSLLELMDSARHIWPTSFRDPFVSDSYSQEYRFMLSWSALYIGVADFNSGPHVCTISNLLTESPFDPYKIYQNHVWFKCFDECIILRKDTQQMLAIQYLPSNSSIKEVLLSLFFKRRCQA